MNNQKITIKNNDIVLFSRGEDDFISLTDIAKFKNSEFTADVVKNWMRNRETINFLGLRERISNPDFKLVKFAAFFIEKYRE